MCKYTLVLVLASFGLSLSLPAALLPFNPNTFIFAKQERKAHTKPSKKDTYTVSSKPRKR